MQGARVCLAVEVDQVTVGNHAELRKVKLRIQGLKRIKRPADLVESLFERALALRKLR